jgi:hypothetical protein
VDALVDEVVQVADQLGDAGDVGQEAEEVLRQVRRDAREAVAPGARSSRDVDARRDRLVQSLGRGDEVVERAGERRVGTRPERAPELNGVRSDGFRCDGTSFRRS